MKKCPFASMHGFFSKGKPRHEDDHSRLGSGIGPDLSKGIHHAIAAHGEINEQMKMINLTEEELKLLRKIKPVVENNIGTITEQFYRSVLNVEKLKRIIVEHSTIERLKHTLRLHIIEIFDGHVDEGYISKRLGIARIHKRVGLEPKWYLSAFQNLQNALIGILNREITNDSIRSALITAVTKLLSLEQQLVLEAYEKENSLEKEMEYEAVKKELKDQIAELSGELIDLSMDTNSAVEQLVASSGEVNDSFVRTSHSALESRERARDGQELLRDLDGQISRIHESTSEMERSIQELNHSSMEISRIVHAVQEIANQTKILSFNAAIEASRAGDEGRGFRVVADEVNRLAEDTKQTVLRITELTDQSGRLSLKVVGEIRKVQELTRSGKQSSEDTGKLFSDIVDRMQNSSEDILIVEEEMKTLVQTIENIGTTTAKTAASADSFRVAAANL